MLSKVEIEKDNIQDDLTGKERKKAISLELTTARGVLRIEIYASKRSHGLLAELIVFLLFSDDTIYKKKNRRLMDG